MGSVQIVVADDDEAIRLVVSDMLEEAGYAVQGVGDGLSALEAIRAGCPALALLDVTMPVMTGDVALQQLRADGHPIPVIIMTAMPQPQRFLAAGATAVLAKPFAVERLLETVARVLAAPSAG
jgi:CheY-like chemotaxis protein